ncbi:MAG: hypothetical protein Q9187_003826 [Circinaria calcarea]
MLPSRAARSLTKSLVNLTGPTVRPEVNNALLYVRSRSGTSVSCTRRVPPTALTPFKPVSRVLQRYASTTSPYDHIDKRKEEGVAKMHIEPHPEAVSVDSTVRHVMREEGVEDQERDIDMLAGVKSDLVRRKTALAILLCMR